MDVADLIRTPTRHWRVVIPVLGMALACALVVATAVSYGYQTQLTIGLVGPRVDDAPPATPTGARINPYGRNGDRMQVARDAVIDALMAGRASMPAPLSDVEVEAAAPDTPVLLVTARSDGAASARASALEVAAAAERELAAWQAAAGVPANQRIRAQVVAGPDPATRTYTRMVRAAGLVVVAGLLAAFVLALALESAARARRRHPAHAAPAAPVPAWRDPVGLLTAWVVLLFLLPSRLVVAGVGFNITPAVVVGAVALVWWLSARLVRGSGLPAGAQPAHVAVGLLAVALLFGYIAASTRPIAGDELHSADRTLITMLTGFGVALLAADGIGTRARLDALLDRLVLAGAVLAALGAAQFLTGFDVNSWLHIPGLTTSTELTFIRERLAFRRVAGTASHPIEFGVALAVIFPLALHRAAQPGPRRLVRLGTVGMIALAIPMSLSRSALLSLAVIALIVVPTWPWRRRLVLLAALPPFALALGSIAPGLLSALESLFLNLRSDSSYHGRTEDYAAVGQFIKASPLLGRGLGTFSPVKYVLLDNQYLGALIELGAVGLAALLLTFLIGAGTARAARRRPGADPVAADLAQSLAAAILALGVSFATFDAFAFPLVTGLLFLLCGCAGALWRLTGTDPVQNPLISEVHSLRELRNSTAGNWTDARRVR